MAREVQIVIDCADPARLATFWASALHYELQPPPEGFDSWQAALASWGVPESEWNKASAVVDPSGAGPRVFFQQVPEPKRSKNRVHLDIRVGGGPETAAPERQGRVDAEAERLRSEGGTVLRVVEERGERWVVMGDPEANEFCVT